MFGFGRGKRYRMPPDTVTGDSQWNSADPPPDESIRRQELSWTPSGQPVQGSVQAPDVYTESQVGLAYFQQWDYQPVPPFLNEAMFPPNIRQSSYYAPVGGTGLQDQLQLYGGGAPSFSPGQQWTQGQQDYMTSVAKNTATPTPTGILWGDARSSDRAVGEGTMVPGGI